MTRAGDSDPWPRGRQRDGGVDEVPVPGVPGRLWLCGKHAVGPDPTALLDGLGAEAVVCLTERHEIHDRYPAYASWLDAERGGRARWHPVHDLAAPSPERFAEVVDEVLDLLRAGTGVVVHCGAGFGRAGTLAAGVLVAAGVPLDDALATVARHRPMAGPEVGAQRGAVEHLSRSRQHPPR